MIAIIVVAALANAFIVLYALVALSDSHSRNRRLARASVLRRIENYPSPVSGKWWCPNHGYGCKSCNE